MVKNRSRTCLGRPLDALSLQLSNFKRFLIDFDRFGNDFWHVFAFRAASQVVLCAQIEGQHEAKRFFFQFFSYFLTCEAFRVEGLTSMIKATSSRSMDGWMDGSMDGWRSTNHWKGGWMVRQGPKLLGLH